MSSTRLFLIRHGATQLSSESRFSGDIGVDLSDEGRAQVETLAKRLSGEKISAIYASTLDRAKETARILAAPHANMEVQTRDGLREIKHGRWEGLTRDEVEAQFPGEYESWEADPLTFSPVGGESGLAVLTRALPVIREIVLAHTGGDVMVVAHKATLRLVISSLLGFDGRRYRDSLDQSPACLNVVDFKDVNRARLMLFNDISHYQPAPRRSDVSLSRWWDKAAKK